MLVQNLQLAINGLALGCIYGLVALGFVLIYKATELVNFAQGDLLMLGAFLAFTFIVGLGLDYWIGLVLAVLCMAVLGAFIDAVILRRIIGQPQFSMVMLTIGLGFLFRSFASMAWDSETHSIPTPWSASVINVGGVVIAAEYLSIIVGTLLLCGLLFLFFRFTRLGIAMQAASQNQLAAYYMGIPVKRIYSLIWTISAGVAAIAGVLLAPVSLIDVNMGLVGLKSFAAAVLGGFGSIPGALVGGLIIGLIELFSGVYLDDQVKDMAPYAVLLVVLVLRPEGLFGALGRKKV
jgi:branched-chain amino acid transport system permease protein